MCVQFDILQNDCHMNLVEDFHFDFGITRIIEDKVKFLNAPKVVLLLVKTRVISEFLLLFV